MSAILSFLSQFHEEIGFLLMFTAIVALFLKNDHIVISIFTITSFVWTALFISTGSYTAAVLVFVTGVRMAINSIYAFQKNRNEAGSYFCRYGMGNT